MRAKKAPPAVAWFCRKRKRPIAYSTISDSDAIHVANEPNKTPRELLAIFSGRGGWIGSPEIRNILRAYIDVGCGDETLKTHNTPGRPTCAP